MPQKAKFKAIFRLSTQQKNGVEDLKAILRSGLDNSNEDFPLSITVIAAPKYMI